jgi:flagellar basal body-associated protein FliL
MADNKGNQHADDAAPAPAKPKKKLPMTLIIVLAVSIVEGVGFYIATTMFGGGPQVAHAAEDGTNVLHGEPPVQKKETAEIQILSKFRVPNNRSGTLFIYDFDLYVKVYADKKADVEKLVEEHSGELSDRVARIVRGNDDSIMQEPDLKTLRLQIRHTLGEMLGEDEFIVEVLIPRCVPIRSS